MPPRAELAHASQVEVDGGGRGMPMKVRRDHRLGKVDGRRSRRRRRHARRVRSPRSVVQRRPCSKGGYTRKKRIVRRTILVREAHYLTHYLTHYLYALLLQTHHYCALFLAH